MFKKSIMFGALLASFNILAMETDETSTQQVSVGRELAAPTGPHSHYLPFHRFFLGELIRIYKEENIPFQDERYYSALASGQRGFKIREESIINYFFIHLLWHKLSKNEHLKGKLYYSGVLQVGIIDPKLQIWPHGYANAYASSEESIEIDFRISEEEYAGIIDFRIPNKHDFIDAHPTIELIESELEKFCQ